MLKKKYLGLLNISSDEAIGTYAFTGDHDEYNLIIPKGQSIDRIDIAGCIEETLHRILNNGGNETDIRSILGARKRDSLNMEEFEEDELTDIDLGYVLPGMLLYACSDPGRFDTEA